MPGTVKEHEPLARAVSGDFEQLTYIQSIDGESAPPGVYSPIQSLAVGLVMPVQVALTAAPRATVIGLTVRVTPPAGAVTVNELLVARRV